MTKKEKEGYKLFSEFMKIALEVGHIKPKKPDGGK